MTNVPGSEITGKRGGIHNSVTRATLKPTHMIGGYAHHSYGFNYYGTVGSNRDEFVIMRKVKEVDWRERQLLVKRETVEQGAAAEGRYGPRPVRFSTSTHASAPATATWPASSSGPPPKGPGPEPGE